MEVRVKIVVSDDAVEFEEQMNRELEFIGTRFLNILFFQTKDWRFSAMITYTKDEE